MGQDLRGVVMAWPLLVMAAVSVASSVYSGAKKKEAANDEADRTREQGRILYAEAQRDASLIRKEGDRFAQMQSQQYIGAGFKLKRSALIVLADTRRQAGEKAGTVERRGKAQSTMSNAEAEAYDNAGRAALVSGVMQGVSSAISIYGGSK